MSTVHVVSLLLIVLLSFQAYGVTIEVVSPEDYRVRSFTGTTLVQTSESLPDRIRFEIPDQFVSRLSSGQVDIERSLERWRMGTRTEKGTPLVYPGRVGQCAYQFGTRVGCDMYPFKNEQGETRYIALRFMARESEQREVSASDYIETKVTGVTGDDGKPIYDRLYQRSTFVEQLSSGGTRAVPKPVDLLNGKRPEPIILGGEKGFVRTGVQAIRGYVDYTEADAKEGVTCEGPQNPLQCLICNCHHETGITDKEDKFNVGKVVMTRLGMETYNPGGRGTVCDMIYEQKAQFSWFFDGKKEEVVKGESFKICLPLMKKALAFRGHFASHYHANWMNKADVMWLRRKKKGGGTEPNCRGKTHRAGTKVRGHTFYEVCDEFKRSASRDRQNKALGVTQ